MIKLFHDLFILTLPVKISKYDEGFKSSNSTVFKVRLIINDLPGNVGMSSKEVEHSLQDQVVESRRKCTRGFQHWL